MPVTPPPSGIDIKLGYGGGATIDGASVLITAGSLSLGRSPTSINPYSMPNTSVTRTKVFLCPGTSSYSANISFDLTLDAINTFINNDFLCRNKEFDVVLSDGYSTYTMRYCKFDSFSISVSPNALVSGTMGFQFKGDWSKSGSVKYLFNDNSKLVKYWNAGNEGVESFTMTTTQSLTPVYLNMYNGTDSNKENPAYIRAGMMEMSLEVNAFYDWLDHKKIYIGGKQIEIINAFEESKGFSYGGQNDTGSHNYVLKSYGIEKSSDEIFTIT